jgi:hypothetical protein
VSRLLVATLLAGTLGTVLMVGFESPVTRALGMIGLTAFILGGVALIASPEYLAKEDVDGER